MRQTVALLFLAVGLVLASADSHDHHKQHKHSQSSGSVHSYRNEEHYKRPIDFAPQYSQQKEYIYQYDTQIAAGLSDQPQNAVQRMRAQLRLTFSSDNQATAQLQQWQAARMNEDIHQSTINNMMSFENLHSMEIPKRHLELLEKPFEISYEQGKVKEMSFDSEDNVWSENIKRAVINGFQLRMDIEERSSMNYRVNETTLEGDCQSVYTINPEIKCNTVKSTESRYMEPKDKGQCIQVTKSINFDMCKNRPDLRYNHYRGEEMDVTSSTMEQKKQRALEQSTINQVELKKDDGKYIVRFTRVISHQTMHLTEKSAMISVSVSELQLKAIKKPTQGAAEINQRKSATSLMYSLEFDEMMERFAQEGNEEFVQKQPYLTERNVPDVLVNIGKRLAQSFIGDSQNEWSMDSDSAAHQFTNLVKMLRHATKKDLEKAEERLFQKDDDIQSAQQKSTLEKMFNDALSLAGTQVTIQRLMEKINEKKLSEREAAASLQKLARNIPIIGKDALDSVWQLCQKADQGTDLQHACVLSWARLANTMCGHTQKLEQGPKIGDMYAQDKKTEEARCSDSLKSELTNSIKKLYDDANEDTEQRILALKAYGNAGIDSSIQQLEQIINDRKLNRLERIVAIDAVRQLVNQMPHKIRRVLMNVFLDKRDHPEVRMNALHQILRAQPEQPTISQIVMETMRESNMNLRTFVMSELHAMALKLQKINSKSAQEMLNAVQLFKRTSPEELEQMRRSGSRFNTIKMEDGHLAIFAALYSNDSSLPKELMMQVDAAFREHFIPAYLQIGVHQQDIEQLLTKVYDRIGSQSMNEILVRGKRSTLQSLYEEPVETMKRMYNHLRIVARRQKGQSSLMFYQREKNMDMWFVLIDEKHMPETIKSLFMDGEIDISALETQGNRQLRSVNADFLFEAKLKVPTTFGVPIVATVRSAKVTAMYGSITTELNSQGKYIISGRVSMKTTPKVSVKMVQKLEVFSPLFTAGVQVQHTIDGQIPLGMEASFSSRDGLVIDFKLPEHNDRVYKLLHITTHPSTLYREWPQKSRVYIEHEERTLLLPQLQDSLVNIDKQMHCPLTQLKLEVRGHLHPSEQGIYLGENVMEVHAHVTEKTAKIVRFQFRMDSKSADGQSLEIQRLMRIFDEKRQQLFQGSSKPEEVQMLKEYLQRHSTHAHSLYEVDVKLMALASKDDKTPREQLEVLTKALCDKDLKMCTKEMHFQARGSQLTGSINNEWSARIMSTIARPTITGLHGSIRSEHVLVHVEAEMSDKSNKDSLVLCAYGRPSQLQIQTWNEIKNMRSARRQSESEKFESMEDAEYDRMVMQDLPSRLTPKHYSFLAEYQLSPKSMKAVQPYVQQAVLATKSTSQLSAWALNSQENEMNTAHGQFKGDMLVEGSHINLQINDIHQSKRMPSWSNPSFLTTNMDAFEQRTDVFGKTMEKFGDGLERKSTGKNSENEDSEENELPSRHSFGQRQALRRFGSDHTNNAKCVLDSSYNVQSFDGQKYHIPMSTCYTVLAKDCGSQSSPKFAVLAKKQSERNSALKIKLLVPKKHFELFEESNDKMVIKMNGVQLRDDEYEQNGIHKISETRRPIFVLHCSQTGAEMRFDGRSVMLSIGDEYINRQCGVCGHYNMDSEDTLRKEDNTIASNLKEFHRGYLYRDDPECSEKAQKDFDDMKEDDYNKKSSSSDESTFASLEEKNQGMRSQQPESQEQEKKSNKGKKHHKNGRKQQKKQDSGIDSNEESSEFKLIDPVPMTRYVEEGDMICLTIQPQMGCPKGTNAIVEDAWSRDSFDSNTPEVEFVCMDRFNSETRKLMKQARKGKVVEGLETMRSNTRLMPIKQAKRCSRQRQTMPAEY